jgi:hypothetical protein
MSNPFQSPQTPPHFPQHHGEGDATGGVIPYKNMPALLAYYLGLASLICCIFATPFGIAPVVLGVIGLQRRAANPAVRGTAHAWIGIVLGAVNIVACIAIYVFIAVGAMGS